MEVERLDLRDVDYRAALLYVRRGKGVNVGWFRWKME